MTVFAFDFLELQNSGHRKLFLICMIFLFFIFIFFFFVASFIHSFIIIIILFVKFFRFSFFLYTLTHINNQQPQSNIYKKSIIKFKFYLKTHPCLRTLSFQITIIRTFSNRMQNQIGILIFLISLFLINTVVVDASYSSCEPRDGECKQCPSNATGTNSGTALFWVGNETIINAGVSTQSLIKSMTSNQSQILTLNAKFQFHVSLSYVCCWSDEQQKYAASVMPQFKWYSFLVDLDGFW